MITAILPFRPTCSCVVRWGPALSRSLMRTLGSYSAFIVGLLLENGLLAHHAAIMIYVGMIERACRSGRNLHPGAIHNGEELTMKPTINREPASRRHRFLHDL